MNESSHEFARATIYLLKVAATILLFLLPMQCVVCRHGAYAQFALTRKCRVLFAAAGCLKLRRNESAAALDTL
jgi:hypothetical protein